MCQGVLASIDGGAGPLASTRSVGLDGTSVELWSSSEAEIVPAGYLPEKGIHMNGIRNL